MEDDTLEFDCHRDLAASPFSKLSFFVFVLRHPIAIS